MKDSILLNTLFCADPLDFLTALPTNFAPVLFTPLHPQLEALTPWSPSPSEWIDWTATYLLECTRVCYGPVFLYSHTGDFPVPCLTHAYTKVQAYTRYRIPIVQHATVHYPNWQLTILYHPLTHLPSSITNPAFLTGGIQSVHADDLFPGGHLVSTPEFYNWHEPPHDLVRRLLNLIPRSPCPILCPMGGLGTVPLVADATRRRWLYNDPRERAARHAADTLRKVRYDRLKRKSKATRPGPS